MWDVMWIVNIVLYILFTALGFTLGELRRSHLVGKAIQEQTKLIDTPNYSDEEFVGMDKIIKIINTSW